MEYENASAIFSKRNKRGIDILINMLEKEAKQNTEHPYVVYQRNTYGNVPLWVVIKTLTFGQMSKMYSFFDTGMQSKISKHYYGVSERGLQQFLKALTHFRNICAHNERLFSFRCRLDIPDNLLHKKMNLSKTGTHYDFGKNDLLAVAIAFRYLLRKEEFTEFKRELNWMITQFLSQAKSARKEMLLQAMGFPENWNNIARYKL